VLEINACLRKAVHHRRRAPVMETRGKGGAARTVEAAKRKRPGSRICSPISRRCSKPVRNELRAVAEMLK